MDKREIIRRISELRPEERLEYKVSDAFGFDRLDVQKNKEHPGYYMIWNEDNRGEIANLVKYSTLENAAYWVARNMISDQPRVLRRKEMSPEGTRSKKKRGFPFIETLIEDDDYESPYVDINTKGEKIVKLEYPDLHVEFNYGPRDWDTGVGVDEFNKEIEYVFEVDEDDVKDKFIDWDPGVQKIEKDEEVEQYLNKNFDILVDKFYDKLLDAFRDRAEEDAATQIDPEDY